MKDHEKFSSQYARLRNEDRILDTVDVETMVAFWNKNPDLLFEAMLEQEKGATAGVFKIDGKKIFPIVVKEKQIMLLAPLEKFLGIK